MLIVQKHLQAITEVLTGKKVAPIGELLDKVKELQAERDHYEDLVGEVREEFAEYKRSFRTDADLQAENKNILDANVKCAQGIFGLEDTIDRLTAENKDYEKACNDKDAYMNQQSTIIAQLRTGLKAKDEALRAIMDREIKTHRGINEPYTSFRIAKQALEGKYQ